MIKVKVTKKSKNANTYSTPIDSLCKIGAPPVKGVPLTILGSHPFSGIMTSEVREVEEIDTGWVVHTLNSIYRIDRDEDDKVYNNKQK